MGMDKIIYSAGARKKSGGASIKIKWARKGKFALADRLFIINNLFIFLDLFSWIL